MKLIKEISFFLLLFVLVGSIFLILLSDDLPIFGNWYERELYFDKITEQYTGENINIAIIDSGLSDNSSIEKVVSINENGRNFEHGDINVYLLNRLSPSANITMYDVVNENDTIEDTDYIEALAEIEKSNYNIVVLPLGGDKDIEGVEQLLNNISSSGTILVGAVGDSAEGQIMYPARYETVIPVCASMIGGSDYGDNNGYPSQCYYFPGADIKYENEFYSGSSYATAVAAAYIANYLEYNPQANQSDVVEILEFIKGENNTGYNYVFDIGDRNVDSILYSLYSGFIGLAFVYKNSKLKKYKDKYGKL